MQLNVRDAARLLSVPERTIYKWTDEGTIPFYLVNEQYHFNHTALLEWASARKIPILADFFDDQRGAGQSLPTLVEALSAGGVHHAVEGIDRESALRASRAMVGDAARGRGRQPGVAARPCRSCRRGLGHS